MDEIDRDQAFNEQLLESLIARARTEQGHVASLFFCQRCGEPVPEKRRRLIPGVSLCIECQAAKERLKRYKDL